VVAALAQTRCAVVPQELLRRDGALMLMLHPSSLSSPVLAERAHPCAMLACAAVKLLGGQAAPRKVNADFTWQLVASLLLSAGEARPAT